MRGRKRQHTRHQFSAVAFEAAPKRGRGALGDVGRTTEVNGIAIASAIPKKRSSLPWYKLCCMSVQAVGGGPLSPNQRSHWLLLHFAGASEAGCGHGGVPTVAAAEGQRRPAGGRSPGPIIRVVNTHPAVCGQCCFQSTRTVFSSSSGCFPPIFRILDSFSSSCALAWLRENGPCR